VTIVKHPQNGPTFSKTPAKKRSRMTDAELAAWQARQDAELEERKRTAAEERSFHQLINKDPKSAIQKLMPGIQEAMRARRARTQ
jgi:hypothetical protein